jgi:hypothetical protein
MFKGIQETVARDFSPPFFPVSALYWAEMLKLNRFDFSRIRGIIHIFQGFPAIGYGGDLRFPL